MNLPEPKITILLAARKNSKYLAKFLFGLLQQTGDLSRIEVICMAHEHDTWNSELFNFFGETITGLGIRPVKFIYENTGLGRGGLAEYFNTLVKQAKGEWIIYFCDDHYINKPDWDLRIYNKIRGLELDCDKVYCMIPKFDNVGAMNQILSRGYIKAMGGYLGRHGNIDSYINDVNLGVFADFSDRLIRFDEDMFHDFTHDVPNMMAPIWSKVPLSNRGKHLPKYINPEVQEMIAEDVERLKAAIEAGK